MSTKHFLSGIVFVLLLASCAEENTEFQVELNQSYFSNSWIHAYEKDCGMRMNFQSYDDSYISSWRLRNRLELFADGSAIYDVGSPEDPHINDAITSVNGHWTFDAESSRLMILNTNGEIVFAFMVKKLTDGMLIMSYTTVPIDPNSK
jgi:hypothetical protein